MKKLVLLLFAIAMMALTANAAPTDFASAIPSSLIPTGFWQLVLLVFGLVATIGGIVAGISLMKRSRN